MSGERYFRKLLVYLLLVAVALGFFAPVAMMLFGSFKPDDEVLLQGAGLLSMLPADFSWFNYQDVFARVQFLRYLFNSALIGSCIVASGLLVNSMAGYAFARLRWAGRERLLLVVVALMIIPLEAIAVPLFYQVTLLGWRDTYWVQIIPFVANAFAIYLFYSFFLDLPRELEEAARIDGAGPWRIFFFIVAPNAKPVFATVAVLTFLTQWGAFLWPLMVTHSEAVRPLPLGIAMFYSLPPLQWGDIFAFGVMMVTPVLLIFVLFQRWFVQGVATTGIKG
jgi:multiple sugar transport system permease protein